MTEATDRSGIAQAPQHMRREMVQRDEHASIRTLFSNRATSSVASQPRLGLHERRHVPALLA